MAQIKMAQIKMAQIKMAQIKPKEKTVADDVAPGGKPPAKKANRASKKAMKREKRGRFLNLMPKGGVAIEIGVWRGEFSRSILNALEPSRLCLIDPWKNFDDHDDKAFSGREHDDRMDQIFCDVVDLYQDEIKAGTVIVMREMSGTALKKFKDNTINFAYVDGDHSYEGVKADLDALMPKMVVGGVMAFDDYHRRGWWKDGVLRAIHEFIGAHPAHVRIRTVIGAQIAIEKIEPLPD